MLLSFSFLMDKYDIQCMSQQGRLFIIFFDNHPTLVEISVGQFSSNFRTHQVWVSKTFLGPTLLVTLVHYFILFFKFQKIRGFEI